MTAPLVGLCVVALVLSWIASTFHPESWLVYAGAPRTGEIAGNDPRLAEAGRVVRIEVDGAKKQAGALVLGQQEILGEAWVESLFEQWGAGKLVAVAGRRGDGISYRVAARCRELGVEPVYVVLE